MANTPKWGKLGGGSGKMHSFKGVGTQAPGGSAVAGSGASKRDIAPKSGGASAGFYSKAGTNTSFAGTQTPGQSSSQPTGNKSGFAKGGTTSMFGPTGSRPARGGQTSQ